MPPNLRFLAGLNVACMGPVTLILAYTLVQWYAGKWRPPPFLPVVGVGCTLALFTYLSLLVFLRDIGLKGDFGDTQFAYFGVAALCLSLNMLLRMVAFYFNPDYEYVDAIIALRNTGQRSVQWMGHIMHDSLTNETKAYDTRDEVTWKQLREDELDETGKIKMGGKSKGPLFSVEAGRKPERGDGNITLRSPSLLATHTVSMTLSVT